MAFPYRGVTLCKRFTNKYVPVVIGLRANNVRPYGARLYRPDRYGIHSA